MKNERKLLPWSRGQVITDTRMNNMVDAVNRMTQGVASPREKELVEKGEEAGTTIFDEVSRTTSNVLVTDSNGDTHQITQIDSVSFEDADGNRMTLNFSNP